VNDQYRLRLLGPIVLESAGASLPALRSRKALALLGYLVRQDQPVARGALVGMFWGETSDTRARHNLTRELSQLTARLPDCLQADYHTLRWAPADRGCVDTAACASLLAPSPAAPIGQADLPGEAPWPSDAWFAHAASDRREPARLDAAVALYRGEFLSGLYLDGCPEFETWLVREREYWRRLVTDALDALIAYYALRHADDVAQMYARRWLEIESWQEDAHRYLLVLLARNGKRGAALTQYELCRRTLADELGVAPAPETVALYEQIRAGTLDHSTIALTTIAIADGGQSLGAPGADTWSDVPAVGAFYGREAELATLERWLDDDDCRLVIVLGMGGVGKSALAARLANAVAPRFESVIWCSLLNAPSLADTLRICLRALGARQPAVLPTGLDEQLALLLDQLRRRHCLLVFDNLESILQGGERAGAYRRGYEGYAHMIQHLGERTHRSRLLLTSREQPRGLVLVQADTAPVRSLRLAGLAADAGYEMLLACGLAASRDAGTSLISRCSGNPLALKLVAETIRDLFDGDIGAFLHQEALIFDDIRDVLDQQFARMSDLQRELLLRLAIEREPVTPRALVDHLVCAGAGRAALEALRALQRLSLLEARGGGVMLQNLVMEYATDHLIERLY
jgi:DNA-binding SARP family transcriptional activator